MACAKDGTQAAIGIHLKSTLLSICPVFFCAVLFVLLFFVCFAFCGFCFVCFLVGLCSLSAIGLLYGLCKGPHQLSFVAFHAYQFNFRQVKACVTTWRKPRRRWTEKKKQNIPSQRVTDLEASIRQLRQIGCILDSCTISASYEVTQAQKAILQLHHTARGASTSSEELNAQISPRADDEHNLPSHEDYLQEH